MKLSRKKTYICFIALVISEKNKNYFKMGQYRDRMKVPMTIYIDEYREKQLME